MIVDACIYIYILYFISYVILIVIHQFGYGSRMGHQHPWLHVPGHIATNATKKFVHSTSAHSRKIHLCYKPIKKKVFLIRKHQLGMVRVPPIYFSSASLGMA